MKKLFYIISVVAFMASFASCGKIEPENNPADEPTIEAPSVDGTTTLTISADITQTKTVWDNTNSIVKWSQDDIITVLAQGASAKSSACASSVETENFTVTGWPADVVPQYAAFTGPDNSVYEDYKPILGEDGRITVSIRNKQELYNKNSFGKVANVSIGELVAGENGTYSTVMRNIGGLIKFQLTVDAYSVEISDVNGDALAGTVAIKMTDGIPVVDELVSTNSKVIITSRIKDEIGVLKAGNRIMMACVLPGEFNFKVAIYNSAEEAEAKTPTREFTAQSAVTINRNEIWDFGRFDNTPLTPPTPGEGGDDPVTPPTPEEPEQPEIPATLELTLDFKDWNFKESKRTSASHTTDDGDVLTLLNTDYQIVIVNNNTTSQGYYCRAGIGLQVNQNASGDGNFTLRFPAIEGMKLTSVYVENPNNKYFRIMNSGKGTVADATIQGGKHTFTISEPVVNSNYYLASKSKNAQISKVVLTYTK